MAMPSVRGEPTVFDVQHIKKDYEGDRTCHLACT